MADGLRAVRENDRCELVPLIDVDSAEMEALLEEEVGVWKKVLRWDYSNTARLIQHYARAGLIPGVGLRRRGRLVGYGYYLLREELGSIGAIFGSPSKTDAEAAAAQIFSHVFGRLVADLGCRRVEGQLFTLTHSWQGMLQKAGLAPRQRFYMMRSLAKEPVPGPSAALRSWEMDCLPAAANLLYRTYQSHADAELSVLYRTVRGCEEFLRNVMLVPGCGEFLSNASALFVDSRGELGGFVLATQIAPQVALIPQICVRPDLQGKGMGSVLLEHTCARLRDGRFRELFLCVTGANEVARRFYFRHRFRDVQSFSAFCWNRDGALSPRLLEPAWR
ncbi:MAG: GNAT family N-acetyltransferase [Acidobacteria bacterium]|nr:GNAT family N-acetyltransferase [Acidobacteriota bacterium]